MLNTEYIGKVLLCMYNTVKVERIGTVAGKEWYFINDNYPEEVTNGCYGLWDELEMQRVLSKQEYYQDIQEKDRINELKRQKKEAEELRIKAEKENLFGFTDNKSDMQKGKILKTLMIKYKYSDYGVLTRRDFVIKSLEDGNKPTIARDVQYWGKNGITKKDIEYRMECKDDSFIVLTKTEYDFANYLLNNGFANIEKVINL